MPVLERISERMSLAAVASLAAIVVAATACVASANAGKFHVYSCRTPSGEVAPVDGWSGSAPGYYSYALDTCQQAGALLAALGDQPHRTANSELATWTFTAPDDDRIAAARLWRAGDADGGTMASATYEFWLSGPHDLDDLADVFDGCVGGASCPTGLGNTSRPLSAENLVEVPTLNLGSNLYANVGCIGKPQFACTYEVGDPNGYAAAIYLYAADLTLEQEAGPSASNVGGELATASSISGSGDVTFDASDPGSGVYQAVFAIDGQVVQRTTINEEDSRCRDVGQTSDGLPAFLYLQPCPASVSADVGFDATKLSDGVHHLVVSVTDAAGNSAPVLDRQIVVANPGEPGPPNGINASAPATLEVGWQGYKHSRLVSRFGARETIVGRLTGANGQPIVGAQVGMTAAPSYAGARPVAMPTLMTAPDGTFRVRLPGGLSSRTLRFSYSSHLDEAPPTATGKLALVVHAGMTLRVSPRTASVGNRIFFHGRLTGGPVPKEGKQLVLEARSPGGRWLEFNVVRTDARGRFHASYRFKFAGPADYQFRVRSEPESDYPFAAGVSHVVAVHER